MRVLLGLCIALLLAGSSAVAATVGEAHLLTTSPTAPLRNASHRSDVRVTIWYPSVAGAIETRRTVGPPGKPLFEGGSASDEAALAAEPEKFPVVLVSHGFGGSARMMSWFGTELAREGYIVVAVDHPGNNGSDPMTIPGAALWWERAEDLRSAWHAVQADARFASRADPSRLGVGGFSAGGFTALVAAGARVDLAHFDQFCADHPEDGVCRPQVEMSGVSGRDRGAAFNSAAMKNAEPQAADDHSIPGVRAVFLLAPALIQALQPDSLKNLSLPITIVLGSADSVAPPDTNGDVVQQFVQAANLFVLDGVGHYDFLSTCTDLGQATVPLCHFAKPQDETHRAALTNALALFDKELRPEKRTPP